MLCLFNHITILFLIKKRSYLTKKLSTRFLLFLPIVQKIRKLLQLHNSLIVTNFHILQRHINNQNQLLPDIVECDHLVKQHQINILKIFGILYLTPHSRFTVSQIIIGKVSDKSARKGRQIRKPGTLIICKNLSQIIRRIIRFDPDVSCLDLTIDASDLHLGIKSKKGIPSPLIICPCRFKHITMRRYIFQNLHGFDWGCKIGKKLTAYRDHIVFIRCCNFLHLTEFW